MQRFTDFATKFAAHFDQEHFPKHPATLYDPARYFLGLGGKRVRPVACLMGNELFETPMPDVWHVATAIELFHNFTLIHDDIMDRAPLRRNKATVHALYGESTALLAGDVMLVAAYEELNKINHTSARQIIALFNKTANEVCEGQQLDMDFEKEANVNFDAYLNMINLKTSVLLGASLQMGAMMGGAGERNQRLLYEFGRKLGLAFQVQDDYLDAFGNPDKFGKTTGGDIMANKKTFLLVHVLQTATEGQRSQLQQLLQLNGAEKLHGVLKMFEDCGVREWALQCKEQYLAEALQHLDDIAVVSSRKEPLHELALFLINRDY